MYINSINQENKHHSCSDRYQLINTGKILESLVSHGWNIRQARQAWVRRPDKQGFQKHLIRLDHNDFKKPSGENLELVIVNSHDKSAAFQLHAGILRIACMNGIVAGDMTYSSYFRHNANTDQAIEASFKVIESSKEIFSVIDTMKTKQLSLDDQINFAAEALKLRELPINTDLLLERRYADLGNDLWTVFNRVQENLIRGQRRKYRSLTSIDKEMKINKELWNHAVKLIA